MKKILFFAATLGGGGAERVMLNLANKMYEKGNDVVIIKTAGEKQIIENYTINDGIKIEKISCKYKNKFIRVIYKLFTIRSFIKKYADYTIISFLPDVNIYTIVSSFGLKNRVIVSERNDPSREPNRKIIRIIRDIVYNFSDFVVFQTRDAQKYFSSKIQKKSCIIANPVNIDELPLVCGSTIKKNVIIMVCRVKPQKNVGMMIDAINYIRDKIGDTTVEIYGDGNLYRDKMKEKVNNLGLENVIKFMGPSKDVYSIMEHAMIYISTSDYEGISNTMLEALAIGVPCIVTDCPIGGARMFIKHDDNGILVPCGDYKTLGNEILRLISSPDLQEQFSRRSVEIRKKVDLNVISEKWLDLI